MPYSLIYDGGFILNHIANAEWRAILCFGERIAIHLIYDSEVVWVKQEIREVLKLNTLTQCERKILWYLYHKIIIEDEIGIEDDCLVCLGKELHINQLRRHYECKEFLKVLGYPIISL